MAAASTTELTEQVVVRLDTSTLAALREQARENERNVTQEIRLAIRRHLQGHDRG